MNFIGDSYITHKFSNFYASLESERIHVISPLATSSDSPFYSPHPAMGIISVTIYLCLFC